jgi:hypothetical protein
MTPDEHMLTLTLFAAQLHFFRALFELLQSRGIAEASDFDAFLELVKSKQKAGGDLALSAFEYYLSLAKALGVDTGLASQKT